ncbi:Outer membrane protein B precursor [compost metagenome]
MTLPFFRRSLISIAVAVSPPSLAETIQLNGQQVVLGSPAYTSPLTLIGQVADEGYGVELQASPGSAFSSILNQASLTVSGEGSRALSLSGPGGLLESIQGDLTNDGQIVVTGQNASEMLLDATADVRGDLSNKGTILASGMAARGIALSGASVSGLLLNTGSVEADGNSGTAVLLENGASVHAIVNEESGRIIATGDASRGISIEQGRVLAVPNSLTNHGRIQVSGRNSVAVSIDHPENLSILINQGVISARGEDSRAIRLDDGYPGDGPATAGLHLVNVGEIRSDGIALEVAPNPANYDGFYPWTGVDMWDGLIEGKQAAIRGAGNVSLNFDGGEIRGDLLGLREMSASGDALFNGQLIQSSRLFVTSLELGQPHTRLEGNLEFFGSILDLNLHSQTDPKRAILEVSGTTEYEHKNLIRLKPSADDFRGTPLRQYVLLSAETILNVDQWNNGDLVVTSLSDLLQVRSYEVTDTQVTATVSSLSTDEVGSYLSEHGANPFVLPAFTAFYDSTLAQLDEQDPLFQSVITSNDRDLIDLARQLAPEVNGANYRPLVDNQHLVSRVLQARSASLRTLSATEQSETGAWVEVLDSDTDQGQRNGIPGYDADTQGIAVGADGQLAPSTRLGVAYSYLTSDVRSEDGNKTDIQGHGLSLYGNFERDGWFADAGLSYGRYDNESKRYIASTTSKGDYDSDILGVDVLGGYGLQLSRQVLLEPRVAARYSNVQIDGYSERGSTASLAVSSQRYEVGQLGAGMRLAGNLDTRHGRLEPEAVLMAYHDFIADRVSSTSSFVVGGMPFVTQGTQPSRSSYQATLGIAYRLGSMKVGLGYDYLAGADYSFDNLSGRFSYEF